MLGTIVGRHVFLLEDFGLVKPCRQKAQVALIVLVVGSAELACQFLLRQPKRSLVLEFEHLELFSLRAQLLFALE